VATTNTQHRFAVYPNLVRYVQLSAINQVWVSDITYVRLGREFVYLAVVLDLYSRRVVGWALGRNLHTTLPLTALNRAITSRQPGPGLIHHSDRGTQYASNEYVRRLEEAQMLISMSRPARPWENAYCESFMRTLKAEEIDCRAYSTIEELEQNIPSRICPFISTSWNKTSSAGFL
jgi:transposase InsO family protein